MSSKYNIKRFSLIRKLKKEKRISYDLEVLLNSLTLEEIIAMKLELSARAAGNKFYGFPIWYSLQDMIKESLLLFAISSAKTKSEASRFLGLTPKRFRQLCKKFNIEQYINGGDLDLTG